MTRTDARPRREAVEPDPVVLASDESSLLRHALIVMTVLFVCAVYVPCALTYGRSLRFTEQPVGFHAAAADALLHGSSTTPGLRLGVTAENRADPRLVRAEIENEALPHLRGALELDKIPTVLRLQFSRAFDRHIT